MEAFIFMEMFKIFWTDERFGNFALYFFILPLI